MSSQLHSGHTYGELFAPIPVELGRLPQPKYTKWELAGLTALPIVGLAVFVAAMFATFANLNRPQFQNPTNRFIYWVAVIVVGIVLACFELIVAGWLAIAIGRRALDRTYLAFKEAKFGLIQAKLAEIGDHYFRVAEAHRATNGDVWLLLRAGKYGEFFEKGWVRGEDITINPFDMDSIAIFTAASWETPKHASPNQAVVAKVTWGCKITLYVADPHDPATWPSLDKAVPAQS